MLVFKIIILIFYLILTIESKWKPPTGDKKRIVGGTKADRSEFPFMVGLYYNDFPICGASIFNETIVISGGQTNLIPAKAKSFIDGVGAAHCILYPNNGESYEVIVGAYHRVFEDNKDGQAIRHKIKKIIIHPCYKDETYSTHDIVLFVLDEPIKFNKNVGYIRLPKEDEKETKGEVAVIGWGRTEEGGDASDVLMKVTLKMFDHEECKTVYPSQPPDVPAGDWENNTINEFMICAYSLGKDSCQGDSGICNFWKLLQVSVNYQFLNFLNFSNLGGPIIVKTEVEKNCFDHRQIGIVSFGEGCAREGKPGVYTDIYEYICWILRGDWPTECSSTEVPPCPPEVWSSLPKQKLCQRQDDKPDDDKARNANKKNFGCENTSISRLAISFGFLIIIFRINSI